METLTLIAFVFAVTVLFVCVFAAMVASGCGSLYLMFTSDNKFLMWAPLWWFLSIILIFSTIAVLLG